MLHIFKAIFDKRKDAQRLLDRLLASGFRHADSTSAGTGHGEGFGASARHAWERIFGTPPHEDPAPSQDDSASAQHVVIFTSESAPEARRAAGIIDNAAPMDVEKHDERPDEDTAGAFLPGVAAIRTVYPPGTRPGSLQFRSPEDSPYFGTQNAGSPPSGNTFQERTGRSPWASPDEDEAAYRYGEEMRASDPSPNPSWEESEPALQSGWEDKQGHADVPAWHRIKEAVRRGWDRVRHLPKDASPG
jgi:hypothetical protein